MEIIVTGLRHIWHCRLEELLFAKCPLQLRNQWRRKIIFLGWVCRIMLLSSQGILPSSDCSCHDVPSRIRIIFLFRQSWSLTGNATKKFNTQKYEQCARRIKAVLRGFNFRVKKGWVSTFFPIFLNLFTNILYEFGHDRWCNFLLLYFRVKSRMQWVWAPTSLPTYTLGTRGRMSSCQLSVDTWWTPSLEFD